MPKRRISDMLFEHAFKACAPVMRQAGRKYLLNRWLKDPGVFEPTTPTAEWVTWRTQTIQDILDTAPPSKRRVVQTRLADSFDLNDLLGEDDCSDDWKFENFDWLDKAEAAMLLEEMDAPPTVEDLPDGYIEAKDANLRAYRSKVLQEELRPIMWGCAPDAPSDVLNIVISYL